MAFHTIDDHTRDILYLSKINIEYDIYLSSLKKQLIFMRERRKKTQKIITNLKRKILELQKEEEKSIKQLENTKKYIKNIINNRKKNKSKSKKNVDIKKSTRNINFNKTYNNRSPNYKLSKNSDNNLNTWADSRKKPRIKNQKLGHINCYSGIYNRDNLLNKKNKFQEKMNYNFINFNSVNPTIYNRKKVEFNNKKQKFKNVNSNNNIKLKESLVQQLKKDEEEQMKIKKQLEEIEKEQNSLFNNFYEDIAIYDSSKTFNLDENNIKYNI